VSMHELTHYLYEAAPAGKHLALMQQFVQTDVPSASALYALLNEALAVSVQGIVAEFRPKSHEGTSDDDGYRHPFIPRLGRSTVSVLTTSLANGSTLSEPGFSKAYVREAIRELGADVTNPKFFLTAAAILPTDKASGAYEVFLQEFQPVSFIRSDQFRLFPHLNLVFLVAYDVLGGLSSSYPALASRADKRGFAYMDSRDGKASVCILAGADADAIADVVREFAKLKSVTSSGFVLAID